MLRIKPKEFDGISMKFCEQYVERKVELHNDQINIVNGLFNLSCHILVWTKSLWFFRRYNEVQNMNQGPLSYFS